MKIVFEKVVIENFLSIGSAEVSLNESGITLVSGVNQQDPLSNSNGSGKSSIFEAILWCLTGFTSRGSSAVSNIQTNRSASVTLSLLAEGSSYLLTRTASPSNLKIIKDGQDISGNTFTKSKKILSDLLNFVDYDMLSSIIILTQGLGGRLSNLKPSERKGRLELFSNLQQLLEAVTSEVNDVTNSISTKYNNSVKELAVVEGKMDSNKQLIQTYTNKIKEIEANRDKILTKIEQEKLEQEITQDKQQVIQLEEAITTASIERNNSILHKSALENNIANYRKEISEIKHNYVAAMNKVCPLCSQPLHDNSIIEKYDQRLNEISNLAVADMDALGEIRVPSLEALDKLEQERRNISNQITQKQQILLESTKYNSSIDT